MKVAIYHGEDIGALTQPPSSITIYVKLIVKFFETEYLGNIQKLDIIKIGSISQSRLMGLFPVATLRHWWRLVRKRSDIAKKYDVIWLQQWQYIYPFIFSKIKIILTIHGSGEFTEMAYRNRKLHKIFHLITEKLALKQAKLIIVVSQDAYKYYANKYPQYIKKIKFIPTFYNEQVFYFKNIRQNKTNALEISKNKKVILYVGRLVPEKRVDLIIKIFNNLSKIRVDCQLLIVGDGIKKGLERIVEKEGINDVKFLGNRSPNEICDLFNIADISILMSEFEGTPLVMLESLACGAPVFGTKVGDVKKIIKNRYNGWLVDNVSPDRLAKKMSELIDISGKLTENAIKTAREYTSNAVSAKILKCIEGL